jgi:hypothetical protein
MENILVANVEYSPIGLRPGVDGWVTSITETERMRFTSSRENVLTFPLNNG